MATLAAPEHGQLTALTSSVPRQRRKRSEGSGERGRAVHNAGLVIASALAAQAAAVVFRPQEPPMAGCA